MADVVISFVYLQAKTSADCKLTTSLSFPSCPSFVLAGRFTVPTSTITFSYERAAAPFTDVPTETDNPYYMQSCSWHPPRRTRPITPVGLLSITPGCTRSTGSAATQAVVLLAAGIAILGFVLPGKALARAHCLQ